MGHNFQKKNMPNNNNTIINTTNNTEPSNLPKGSIVIPYIQGICESVKNNCGKYGIQTNVKGNRTLMNILIIPKDNEQI